MKYEIGSGGFVTIDKQLGSGGEARIYSVLEHADLVAKIYHQPSLEKANKLKLMISFKPSDPTISQGHRSICWPTSTLINSSGIVIGFLMPRIDGTSNLPIFEIWNPRSRRNLTRGFTWGHLVRVGANLASAVAAIHSKGYVIGDFNESNVLVSDRALVSLVDCDSMQVHDPNGSTVYRCLVGKPEFTPPELVGKPFDNINRTSDQDNFALGVMIFMLLMEGTHPFSGIWQGFGEPPPIEERIRKNITPYIANTTTKPMPGAPAFSILDFDLQSKFQRLFDKGHRSGTARPLPREWQNALARVEGTLLTCQYSKNHVYAPHLPSCPWCERAHFLGGSDPFPSHTQFATVSQPSPSILTNAPANLLARRVRRGKTKTVVHISPVGSVASSTFPITAATTRGVLSSTSSIPKASRVGRALLYAVIMTIGLIALAPLVMSIIDKAVGPKAYSSTTPMAPSSNAEGAALVESLASVTVSPSFEDKDVTTKLLNANYTSGCWRQYPDYGLTRIITIKNGAWDNGQEELDKQAYFGIVNNKITIADLIGANHRVAVVPTTCGLESVTLGYEEIFVIDTSSRDLKVLQRLSSEDWGESSLGLNWRITDIKTGNGELKISYLLGGSHAQPDWNATAGFRWDGRKFVRVDFEAHGEDGGVHQHQTIRKVMPIDEANRDPSLLEFRNGLLAAVERKDAAFVYQSLSPTIKVGFGSQSVTREEFVRAWNTTAPDSKLWNVLAQLLQQGGTFQTLSAQSQFVAPYLFGTWPKDVDPFENCAVTSPDVSLYSQPDAGSTLAGSLSYDVVKLEDGTCVQDKEWSKISTDAGVGGFIRTSHLRSPIDYRAGFEKAGDHWIMFSLTAGD